MRHISAIEDLLKRNAGKIQSVVPENVTPDKLMEIAVTAVQATPAIAECTPTSVLDGVIQSAQVGLSLDPALGQAYLVPFNKRGGDKREKRARLVIGYRGLIHLVRDGGDVVDIFAMPVYDGETYSEEVTHEGIHFKHVPDEKPHNPNELRAVYMLARYKHGGYHFGRMWIWELELVRDRSKAKDSGPWVTDSVEMYKKTVVRREAKYLPLAAEVQAAISRDERADFGIDPGNLIDFDDGGRDTDILVKPVP